MNEWLERCKLERCRTDSILSFVLVQLIVLKNQLELIGKQVQQLVLKNQLELIGKRVPLRGKKNQSPMERIGELVQLNVIPTGHWLLMQALEMLQRWLG